MRVENKKTWTAVMFLIALEQGLKIIINNSYLNKTLPILPPLLYFEPMFNRDYSWFNSMFDLGLGKGIHITFTAMAIILIFLLYRFLNIRSANNGIINFMFAFLFSGALCSLIDKVFWNGSLDYILVKGFFTFDLKDVYLNIFNGLLILSMFTKREELNWIDDGEFLRDFGRFVFRKENSGGTYE